MSSAAIPKAFDGLSFFTSTYHVEDREEGEEDEEEEDKDVATTT